ncbi:unnamed protein product [Rotaria sordida]|uniref:Uncharacterized protein n=1 Tax=Rotaria sordida TaxID=392033 RepID=A0A813MQQ4_9BILA|nr:unnamed protein product [Rotaria sordida]
MTNGISLDPYFDDEDKFIDNLLPPCDPTTDLFSYLFSSLSQSCILCSRVEAETILKTTVDVQSGNFIVPKTFSSFLEYYLTNPIKFQDDSDTKYSIILQLYSNC